MIDAITIKGTVHVQHHRHGRLVREQHVHNLVTASGRNAIRDLMAGGTDHPAEMAVGTSSTTPVSSDTSLGNQVFRKDITQTTSGAQLVTFRVYLTSGEGNGSILREAGIFTTAGVLVARVVFDAVEKSSSDTLTIAWSLSLGA